MPRGKRYGMLPDDVMANPELSPASKVVLAAMAMESYGTSVVALSHQAVATVCGIVRRTVAPALAQLRAQKLIEPVGGPVKQIQSYKLLHPKHAAKEATTETVPDLACAKCKANGKKLNRACYCKACAKTVHPKVFEAINSQIERQIARVKAS